jgi:hypothetical protein
MITRLSGISLLTILALNIVAQTNFFTAGLINDSVYYTDIIPDTTLTDVYGEGPFSRELDIDSNGINDFRLEVYLTPTLGWVIAYVHIIPYGQNGIAVSRIDTSAINECNYDTSYRKVAKIFNYGDTIDEDLTYTNGTAVLAENEWCAVYNLNIFNIEDWVGIGEKYIGGYININNTISYCWILVQATMIQTVTLKEYAVNMNKPNSNEELINNNSLLSIYPNPGKGLFTIESGINIQSINIYNQNGRELISKNRLSFTGGKLTLDLSSFNKGVYIIKICTGNQVFFRKLIVI